jgi:hypothetical protein
LGEVEGERPVKGRLRWRTRGKVKRERGNRGRGTVKWV